MLDRVFNSALTGGGVFHPATGIDGPRITTARTKVRRRLLAVFGRHGLLAGDEARNVALWERGGEFSVDASTDIEGADCSGRE